MRAMFLLGRAIFGGFFIYNGINHFLNRDQMSDYAASKGTPAPDAAILGSGGLLLCGGLSVLTGVSPRQGLAALISFLLPVSLQMHRFWEEGDPGQRQNELINFSKNMALAGAAMMMMQLPAPWPASLERTYQHLVGGRSYPLLSPRDLRALPA